jgi:hypothetical protein
MDLFIAPDGSVTGIYDETINVHVLGTPTIKRASHVEPNEAGQWFAHIIGGPSLGPFAKRSEALTAEVDWLLKYRLTPDTGFDLSQSS